MKKRKITALLTCTAMALSLLAGCGKATENPAPDASTPADEAVQNENDTQTAPADDSEDKVITLWSIGTTEPDATILQNAVDKFNETTASGYTAELVNYPTDNYKEKLTIAMSSGECPDVFTNWTGGPLREYINAGYAVPITDVVNEMGLKDKVMASGIAQGTVDGDIYALPILNIAIEGFYYNKDLFEQVGITEEPATISELEAACDKLVAAGITPFALANQSKWTGSMFFMGLATRHGGLEPFSTAYDGSGTFETECFVYAGNKIQEWVEKGYFPEGVNSLSFDDGQDKQLMYQETAAMTLQGTWQTSTFQADSEEFYQKIGWFPFPAVDGSSADTSIQIGTVGDCFASFNCSGNKLKAAVELVSHFYDDDSVQYAVDAGYLPPVANVADLISDEINKENLEAALNASTIQLWYDQYLPPAVSDVHQSTCQELFGLTMTPEDANKELQQAMQDYLAEQ